MNNYPARSDLIANGQRVHAQIVAEQTCPTKTCSKCGHDKPRDEFAKHSTSSDGLQAQCRSCISEIRALERAERRQEQHAIAMLNADAKAAYEAVAAKALAVTVTRTVKPGIVILSPRAPGRLCYRRHDPAIGKARKL